MARCERGYLCTVCGQEVEEITDSDLYLRYVLGEVAWAVLHEFPERHLRCNPTLAQFIVDDRFPSVHAQGFFSKDCLDAEFVKAEEERVSRGYRRLHEVTLTKLPIGEYPLSQALSRRDDEGREAEA